MFGRSVTDFDESFFSRWFQSRLPHYGFSFCFWLFWLDIDFLPEDDTKISFPILLKIDVSQDRSDQMAWSSASFRWYNYWCCLSDVAEKRASDWDSDLQVWSHCARVCWVDVYPTFLCSCFSFYSFGFYSVLLCFGVFVDKSKKAFLAKRYR